MEEIMCGIIGYIGDEQAAPILIEGLKRLEYRGYDSAGIAVRDGDGDIEIVKACGKLDILSEKTDSGNAVHGLCGIGHTRWATHGEPSERNSHPHVSCDGQVTLVHNGIVENNVEYREKLAAKGYTFVSDTDTEVAANMLAYYYKKNGNDPEKAISDTMYHVSGSYAFGIMFKDHPDVVYVARNQSPLAIGRSDDGFYIASDPHAVMAHTRSIYYIGDREIAVIKRDNIRFMNIDLEPTTIELVEEEWDASLSDKGGYEHFMIKEIEEQPRAVHDTLNYYIRKGDIDIASVGLTDECLSSLERIYIVACGSAYHVAEVAKYEIERVARVPVETEVASEFRYRNRVFAKNSAVIVVSQSGETADSIAALRLAKERGIPVYCIVNVMNSTVARESDGVMYTLAGPEISVATTKAYSAQLAAVYLIAIRLAYVKGELSGDRYRCLIDELMQLPEKIKTCLEKKQEIQHFASHMSGISDAFFMGRGVDYALALEGSLKLKEVSYVHSEACAAGELKHGTISLIEKGTLVVGIMTQEELLSKIQNNISEVKSRGAYVLGITNDGNDEVSEASDVVVYIPRTDPMFTTSLAVVPLQLLSYYVSVAKGKDVDKPRNLAKSVTVE